MDSIIKLLKANKAKLLGAILTALVALGWLNRQWLADWVANEPITTAPAK